MKTLPLLIVLFIVFSATLYPVDLTGLKEIHSTKHFVYFAEDNKDYTKLFRIMKEANRKFRHIFNKRIQ